MGEPIIAGMSRLTRKFRTCELPHLPRNSMSSLSMDTPDELFDSIEDAIDAYSQSLVAVHELTDAENGQFLVVMDDESRENEGDLMLPAQFATTEKFAFLVRHSR